MILSNCSSAFSLPMIFCSIYLGQAGKELSVRSILLLRGHFPFGILGSTWNLIELQFLIVFTSNALTMILRISRITLTGLVWKQYGKKYFVT